MLEWLVVLAAPPHTLKGLLTTRGRAQSWRSTLRYRDRSNGASSARCPFAAMPGLVIDGLSPAPHRRGVYDSSRLGDSLCQPAYAPSRSRRVSSAAVHCN